MEKELALSTADMDAQDIFGRTPLHWAIKLGKDKDAQSLLEYKANPNIADFRGGTPLLAAAWVGSASSIDRLVQFGANLQAVQDDGWTALSFAHHVRQEVNLARLMYHESKLENKSALFLELADEYGYGTRDIEDITDELEDDDDDAKDTNTESSDNDPTSHPDEESEVEESNLVEPEVFANALETLDMNSN